MPSPQWGIEVSRRFLEQISVGWPGSPSKPHFCTFKIPSVSAHIEGMFLQVGVREEDQPSLRFLWREDPTSNMVIHQYTRHIFGARDSPTCANFALQKTVSDNQAEYPEAASAVVQKIYMDDYLDSFQNRDDALKLGRDIVSLLKLGGFHLTKFVSNVPDVTTALDPDNRESNSSVKDICASPDQSSHVLRLKWDHIKDTLVVSRGVDRPLDKAITQRTVLSFVSSVFDPIGLVAPYTVKARLLLKYIWRISGQTKNAPAQKFRRTSSHPLFLYRKGSSCNSIHSAHRTMVAPGSD